MSLEKQIARYHRRMTFWRLVGDLVELPMRALEAIGGVLNAMIRWNAQVSRTVFYMELEAARKYKALTGSDFGYAVGEMGRYSGLDPGRAERAQARGGNLFDQLLGNQDEEDE